LDSGHYKRFLYYKFFYDYFRRDLSKNENVGKTIQIVPQITDEIKKTMKNFGEFNKPDEIKNTVNDMI
jgi:CTP synthase (UTP-ammonia lyase)